MSENVTEILFSLLRFTLYEQALPEKYKSVIDSEVLDQLYTSSNFHDIAPVVSDALAKNGLLSPKDPVAEKFIDCQNGAVYRYVLLDHEQAQICKALENAKIPFIPLKGAIIRRYYPEPYLRTSCDVDVLVHPDDCTAAIQALTDQLGYEWKESFSTHDHTLFAPSGIHLELHYMLIEDERMHGASELLGNVWKESAPTHNSEYAYEMSNEMFLLYHIVHMTKHFLSGGCGIRTIIDLRFILDNMTIDAVKLRSMLEAASMSKFYDAAVELSEVWFCNAKHTELSRAFERFILAGGVYGTVKNSQTVSAAKGEGKIRSFLKLVFLPRRSLEMLYPNLRKRPYLLPYYQVKRWFNIFDKNKRENVVRLTDSRNSISKESEHAIRSLLQELKIDVL